MGQSGVGKIFPDPFPKDQACLGLGYDVLYTDANGRVAHEFIIDAANSRRPPTSKSKYRGGYCGGGFVGYGHHGHSSYYRSYLMAVVVPVAPVHCSYYHPGFGRPSCGY